MKIRKTDKKTPRPWELDLGMRGGKRVRQYFETRADADSAMAEKLNELRLNGENSLALSTRLRLEYMEAEKKCREMGVSITQVVLYYEAHGVRLVPKPMLEAVAECVAAKEASGKRKIYTESLHRTLKSLAAFCPGRTPETISRIQIEQWARSIIKRKKVKTLSLHTVRSRLIDAKTFFNFCQRKHWVINSPCEAIENIELEETPPGIHTLEQVKSLLESAKQYDPALLGFICPVYFGGLRPGEAKKLHASEVHADFIEVQGPKGKGRRRRFVPINETLRAWLAVPGVKYGVARWSRRLIRIRGKSKPAVPWPHDVLRHSFCSYSLPIHGATKTAEWAGHSEQILFAHYRERVKPADAEAYWSLRP